MVQMPTRMESIKVNEPAPESPKSLEETNAAIMEMESRGIELMFAPTLGVLYKSAVDDENKCQKGSKWAYLRLSFKIGGIHVIEKIIDQRGSRDSSYQ